MRRELVYDEKVGGWCMEEAVLFCAFRFSGIGLLFLMLINVHRNRNNRRKMFLIYRMMIFAFPIIILNLLWYLCDRSYIPGGASAALAFKILCYGAVAAETALTLLYGRFYIRIRHASGLRILKALKYMPAVLLVLISIVDAEQTATVVYLMMGAFLLHNSTLSQLISLDPLTRLNNRSEFRNYLNAKMALPGRGRLCLLMMDMNGFKSINDTYGHLEGDAALRRVSMCLKKACADVPGRPFIARYGGDEFVIIMENKLSDLCGEMIRGFRQRMRDHSESYRELPGQVVLAAGMASYVPGTDNSYMDVFQRADEKMYKNKSEFYDHHPEMERRGISPEETRWH